MKKGEELRRCKNAANMARRTYDEIARVFTLNYDRKEQALQNLRKAEAYLRAAAIIINDIF